MDFLDLFFPPTCCGCKELGSFLCQRCEARLRIGSLPVMRAFYVTEDAGDARDSGDAGNFTVHCAFSPSEALREAVHTLKYAGCFKVVPILQRLVLWMLERDFFLKQCCGCGENRVGGAPIFTPVPLHARRERERGFNQSEMLGRMFAEFFGGEMRVMLERGRWTEPQVSLSREGRLRNVRGAFFAQKDIFYIGGDAGEDVDEGTDARKRPIVLVDDIFTTGATLSACVSALRDAGFLHISALVLTHGI